MFVQVGVERDVTLTGGCAVLGVRAPTTSGAVVPQLLAIERRRRHHEVLLLVGEPASPPVLGSSPQAQRRPTSFQPALRRCIVEEDQGGEDNMTADVAWFGRRRDGEVIASRIWRHVDEGPSAASHCQAAHAAAVAAAVATVWWKVPR